FGVLGFVLSLVGFISVSFVAAPGISASPSEENMRYFNVMILGPAQSPYEGGVFKLELFLPEEYPMAAPKVQASSISLHGFKKHGESGIKNSSLALCCWSLALKPIKSTIVVESLNSLRFLCFTFCTSIQALLSAPNPDDPLSENIAKHWKTNEAEAVETGQLIVCLEHYCFMLLFML
ncbi:unnamed protein product, partial [Musa acuminata var. zebrina]